MAAPERGPGGDAIEIFAGWLSRRENGELVEFDELLHSHPHLAAELAELEATWKRLASATDPSHPSPSLQERIKSRFGERSVPEVSLQEPGKDAAQGDFSSLLIAQLSARSTGFGRYRIRGEVARGGMGMILRIWDEDLRRHLAMKVILGKAQARASGATPPVDSTRVARFLEEAQVTGQLDHPGIVPVHELGLDPEGRLYFTMKLVKGRSLKEVFELVAGGQEGWTQTRVLGVLLKVCEAMAYAHDKGVIHRDLKPANIMVGKFGEVHVMDWGLARILGQRDDKDIRIREELPETTELRSARDEHPGEAPESPLYTMDGDVVGTPAYMPPEQAAGSVNEVGPHSDVYALGAMLYHLLTGRMPYVTPGARVNNYAVLSRVQEGPPASLVSLAPDAPAELVAICERAMARHRAARYVDMSALGEDLRAYLENRVVAAYETGAVAELRKWVVRNKPLAAALAAGVLLLAGGLTASLIFKANSDRNAELADANATQAGKAAELAEQRRIEADAQRQLAHDQERLATQKANDVLSLSAIQELKELVERADVLWPAVPEMVPQYEQWLAEAQVLVDGSPTHPGLNDHEAKLAEIRQRAKPLTPDQVEQDRRSSPSFAEWERAQAKLTWMRRMLGEEPWPTEAEVEAALAQESLPPDANGLNALAWPLVDPDPAKAMYGSEVKALLLARRAVAAATDAERAGIRDTLAWALLRCGRAEQALMEEQLAVAETQGPQNEQLAATLKRMQEQVSLWAPGEPRSQQADEAAKLSAHVADLEHEARERRTFDFEDAQDRWWHRELVQLVADLNAFTDSQMGLDSAGTSAQHGWGIAKRAEFARTIEAKSVSGAEAKLRWSTAIDAMGKSPLYGGLKLGPQLGLLPIGADPDSGLWEFWHIQSGDEPLRGADGKLVLTESMGVVLVLIPGGTFWMGAQKTDPAGRNYDPSAGADENPVHDVTLSPYFLSKYEMTQGQWERFTGRNPSQHVPGSVYGKHQTTLLHPVEQVSWDDATDVMPRLGLELPTEAQWECGARGGTDTPWSSGRERDTLRGAVNLADQAAAAVGAVWQDIKDWPELDDGWAAPAAVGSFRPNAFGLHDVHGNVWEWCRDGYGGSRFYAQSPEKEPFREPSGARYRISRGGCCANSASNGRSAIRAVNAPNDRAPVLGLRPARGITP